jgi:hypothetical protein
MRSLRFQAALTEHVQATAELLQSELAAGAEVPFELEPRKGGGPSTRPALYCYRALTGEFIAERQPAIEALPSHGPAAKALSGFEGLDGYLAAAGAELGRADRRARSRAAIRVLLRDVFREQSDFELRPERLQAALERLESAAVAGAGEVTLVATLHGLTIASAELALTKGLTIAQCDALDGLPEGAICAREDAPAEHLVVVLTLGADDAREASGRGRDVLRDLLRALRLFGDGRVTLGSLAWVRMGGAPWSTMALGAGGRPHGMLVVTAEHEDELRAFCNLVSRRAPHGNELAWALQRFELGCERENPYEALTDHLLALRALLEPEGPSSVLLAGRLAALCATPGRRTQLTDRTLQALALERAVINGTAVEHAGGLALAQEVADNLRALLRDVICGHLAPDLAGLADEILLEPEDDGSGEQMLGDAGEPEEILDLLI